MATDDVSRPGQDPGQLAPLTRDVELGPPDHQPVSSARNFQNLFQKHFLSLCCWILAFVSTAVSIAALLPAFRGLLLSDKQLRLAEWSALKDYLNQCKEDVKAGHVSEDYKATLAKPLPPPPGRLFYSDNLDRVSWKTNDEEETGNMGSPGLLHLISVNLPLIILLICCLAWRHTQSRYPDKNASPPKARQRPTRKSLKIA